MKIKLLSLVLLSSFAATTNAADNSADSSSSSSTTGAASLQRKVRNTPNSPLGKLATGGESGAVKSGGRFAALVFGGGNPTSSLAQSTPLPSSKTATAFDPFGTLTVEPKVNNLSTTLGTSTSTTPATVTTSSTTAATANTTKSSTASKLAASGVFGDDDDDDLFGSSVTTTAPKATTIAKSDPNEALRVLRVQFESAEQASTKLLQEKEAQHLKALKDAQNELDAATKENVTKANQLTTLQGLHDAQVAEVKRLQGVVDSKEQELATLKANAAQGSSAGDATTIQNLTKDLDTANKALEVSNGLLNTLGAEKDKLEKEVAGLRVQIDDQAVALTELAKVKADLKTANSRVVEVEAAKGKVDGELATVKAQVADAERLKAEAEDAKGKVDQKLVNLEVEVASLRATNGDLARQNNEAKATIANHTAAFKKLDDETAAEIDALQAGQNRFLKQLQEAVFGEAFRTAQDLTGNPIDKDDSAMVGSILSSNPFFINLMANPFIARLLQESEEPNNSPAPMGTLIPAAVTAGNAAATSTSSVTTLPTVNTGGHAATTTTTTTSATPTTLGNDSDDEGAATTATQGGNNSQKPNQAGNGNGGRGGKNKKRGGKN